MNKICLIGAGGRMGRSITEILSRNDNSHLTIALEKEDSVLLGMDSGLSSGLKENKIPYTSDLQSGISLSDTVIDFSHHSNLVKILDLCIKFSRPIVIGATGHTEAEKKEIESASKKIPIVLVPANSFPLTLAISR